MATRKTARAKKPPACTTCQGSGETSESVVVGSRRKRVTVDRQSGLCPSCLGSGTAS